MKKELIIIGLILIILAIFLSGCTTPDPEPNDNGNEYNPPVEKDSDDDGYPDEEDDFPYDEKFYKKEYIIGEYNPEKFTLEDNIGKTNYMNITQDWKYVCVEWEIVNPPSLTIEQQNYIFLAIITPITSKNQSEFAYSNIEHRNIKFPVNLSNLGEWQWALRNKTALLRDTGDNLTVIIEAKIYKMK